MKLFRLCVLLALTTCLGCQQATEHLATVAGSAAGHAAVPAAVSGLDELAKPENQEKLERVTRSAAIQQSSVALGVGLGKGIIDEIITVITKGQPQIKAAQDTVDTALAATQPATEPAAQATMHPTMHPMTHPSIAAGVDTQPAHKAAYTDPLADPADVWISSMFQKDINPAVSGIVQSTLAQAMAALSTPEARASAEQLSEAIGNAAMRGMLRGANDEAGPMITRLIEQERTGVRPAIHTLLQEEIAPAIRQLVAESAGDALKMSVRPDVSPTVIENARNLSRGGGLGTHDALVELGVFAPSGELTPAFKTYLWVGLSVAVLMTIAFCVLVIVLTMIAWSLWRGRYKLAGADK